VRRIAATVALVALLAGGCASGPGVKSRALAKGLLLALAAGAAGTAAGAAVTSNKKEAALRDDLAMGTVTGRDFATRDAEGQRWNRAARGAVFVGGLAVVALVITWQMGLADRYQFGPGERPSTAPIYPGAPPAAGN
jgi:hypothetical protein